LIDYFRLGLFIGELDGIAGERDNTPLGWIGSAWRE
jgi:hypothetical protein